MAVYRQLAWKLRFHGPDGSQKLSVRPKRNPDDVNSAYTDLPPAAPTLVEIRPGDQVDVGQLLRIGAIAPWVPEPEPDPPEGGETT